MSVIKPCQTVSSAWIFFKVRMQTRDLLNVSYEILMFYNVYRHCNCQSIELLVFLAQENTKFQLYSNYKIISYLQSYCIKFNIFKFNWKIKEIQLQDYNFENYKMYNALPNIEKITLKIERKVIYASVNTFLYVKYQWQELNLNFVLVIQIGCFGYQFKAENYRISMMLLTLRTIELMQIYRHIKYIDKIMFNLSCRFFSGDGRQKEYEKNIDTRFDV